MAEEKRKETKRLFTFEPDKIPPNDENIEKKVLGDIINDMDSLHLFMKISKGENIFYNSNHIEIFDIILELFNKGTDADIFVIQNALKQRKTLDTIGGPIYLTELLGLSGSANNLITHTRLLIDNYIWRFLIQLFYESKEACYNQEDYKDIIDNLHIRLDELDKFFEHEHIKDMHESLDLFLMNVMNNKNGITIPYIKTGYTEFDKVIALRPRTIVNISGDKGCGKSSYVHWIIRGILNNNPNIPILWYSMEESAESIIARFISNKTKLTSRQLESINHTLDIGNVNDITRASNVLKSHNIEIYDNVTGIIKMSNQCKKFAKKHDGDKIIIIDNFGLIDCHLNLGETERDTYLAKEIVKIRNSTDACVIVVHHLVKTNKYQLKEGYRPREEYVRGSSRIIDYANQVLLCNNPKKYHDLIQEEKEKWKKVQISNELELTHDNYLKELWEINPNGDKDTTTCNPIESGWRMVEDHCNNKLTYSGKPITLSFLVFKYKEYIAHVNKVNAERTAEAFWEKKWSVYSWVSKYMYNFSYNVDKTGRDYYLYGNSDNNEGIVEKIFIVEPTKLRDYEQGIILRYYPVNLGFGDFNEWNTNI